MTACWRPSRNTSQLPLRTDGSAKEAEGPAQASAVSLGSVQDPSRADGRQGAATSDLAQIFQAGVVVSSPPLSGSSPFRHPRAGKP